MTKQPKQYSAIARVSRADLLLSLINVGEDNLQTIAELTGYQAPVKSKLTFNLPELIQDITEKTDSIKPKKKLSAVIEQEASIYYYRLIDSSISEILPLPKEKGKQYPDWYYKIPEIDLESIKPADIKLPAKQPIVPWAKLWPVLQALFSEFKRSRQVDMPRLTRTLANAEIPNRIPRQVRQHWTAEVQLLVDRPERTELFNDDYNRLVKQLDSMRGTTGLQIQQIIQRPGQRVRIRQFKTYSVKPWHIPQAGSSIVVLSDLGLLDNSGLALQEWVQFGKRLVNAGFKTTVLLPLSARYLTTELVALFNCVCWTRHSDLQNIQWVLANKKSEYSILQQDSQQTVVKDILAWLSPAVQVEPALLRAVSHCLVTTNHGADREVAVWLHDDVKPTNIGFYYKPEALEKYRQRFKQLARENPVLANKIVKLLRTYHAHVFPSQLHEEMLIIAELMGDKLDKEFSGQVKAAKQHWLQLLKVLNEKTSGALGLPGYSWHYLKRQHQAMKYDKDYIHLPALQGVMSREYSPGIERSFPDDDETIRMMMQFASWNDQLDSYVLLQRNRELLQLIRQGQYLNGVDGFTVGSLLARFKFKPQFIVQQLQTGDAKYHQIDYQPNQESIDINLDQTGRYTLHIAGQKLTLEHFVKPDWAIAVSCQHETITVTTQTDNKTIIWYWHPPEMDNSLINDSVKDKNPIEPSQGYTLPGFWYDLLSEDESRLTPDWADTVNRDQYGLYAEASVAGVKLRFRWIPPGSFRMGSPEDEEGRANNEKLHQVNFSQGFWLAETACTQALWQAVMGQNPSHFKGKNRPVESVSWNDVQQFIKTLNKQQPDLDLRLPTESEWEYACRAGTITAFNFEGKLNLTKVNYHRGSWTHKEDEWTEGARQETAEVKSYSANTWGLYEMHGNVWEWCQDWYGDYPDQSVTDPKGSESGGYRVLRGGSWNSFGRACRSACRIDNSPGYANSTIGFRLARGHQSRQVSTVAVQQPDGSHAAGARGKQPGDGLRDSGSQSDKKQTNKLIDNIKDLFKK